MQRVYVYIVNYQHASDMLLPLAFSHGSRREQSKDVYARWLKVTQFTIPFLYLPKYLTVILHILCVVARARMCVCEL